MLVAACGGGTVSGLLDGTSSSSSSSGSSSSSSSGGSSSYTISASVSGLAGVGLVLQYNGGNNLSVAANGTSTFTTKIASGATYAVTVLNQPTNPAQICTVTAGTGTASANVAVTVTCVTQYTISASVNGLSGTGLILQNNGGNDLAVGHSGIYTFSGTIAAGGAYAVSVLTQPMTPSQTCAVTAGSGIANSNVTVTINCTLAQYTISANVSGLIGSGLVLQDNGGDNLPITTSGTSTFATPIPYGGAYAVTVLTQPGNPSQTCAVTAGSGTATANVTLAVSCANQYTLGGTISGLTGAGLAVTDSVSGAHATVAANSTTFTLSPSVTSGASYNVSVTTQPSGPTESCSVTSGATGTATGNVTTIAISCTVSSFSVGGTISGYTGGASGLVLTDSISGHTATAPIGATSFTLSGHSNSGTTYNVSVTTQPSNPAQHCVVTGGSGNVTTANITTIGVSCRNVGKYVFVANPYDGAQGTVAAFSIAPTTGFLNPVAGSPYMPGGVETAPAALAVDTANGIYLYVADSGSADVSTWGIGPGGVLTQDVGGASPASTGDSTNAPYSLAFDSAGILYAGSYDANSPNAGVPPMGGQIEGFAVSNGALTALTSSPYYTTYPQHSLALDPSDQFLYAPNFGDGTIWEFDIANDGSLTRFAYDGATLRSPYAVAVDPTALFVYATDNGYSGGSTANTVAEYSYDGTTGILTHVTSYNTGSQPQAIAIDPIGTFLYVSNSGDGTVSAFTINSGALTAVAGSPFTASGTASTNVQTALAIDPSGQYLYVANGDAGTISVFTISAGTGVLVKAEADVPCISSSSGGPSAIVIQ
jgi:6-phosphogluconolactonase (cycloisomerase 2 family)